MAEKIHITKPLAVGNDSIAKGFLSFLMKKRKTDSDKISF